MDREFEIAKQELVEIAEQFCGGFVNDYRHAIEKIRATILSKNLSSRSATQRSMTSLHTRPIIMNSNIGTTSSENSVEELQAEIKRCRQIILSQHERISAIPQLESELKDSEKKLMIEISKVNNKHKDEVFQCNKELKQYHKILAQNSQQEEKIKLLTMEIESFRRQFHKEIDSDGRIAQIQELAASRGKEIQKLEIACNKLKVKINLKDQEIQKITNKLLVQDDSYVDPA